MATNAKRAKSAKSAKSGTKTAGREAPRTPRYMDDAAFAELLESVRQAKAVMRGEHVPGTRVYEVAASDHDTHDVTAAAPARRTPRTSPTAAPDVAAVRARLRLTQGEFAALLGVSRRTYEGWEQGRRTPTGAAQALLRVADHSPETVLAALR